MNIQFIYQGDKYTLVSFRWELHRTANVFKNGASAGWLYKGTYHPDEGEASKALSLLMCQKIAMRLKAQDDRDRWARLLSCARAAKNFRGEKIFGAERVMR